LGGSVPLQHGCQEDLGRKLFYSLPHKEFCDAIVSIFGHHIEVAKFNVKPAKSSPPLTGYHLAIFLIDKVAMGRRRASPYPLLFKGGTY
jgi:hypothetical protein